MKIGKVLIGIILILGAAAVFTYFGDLTTRILGGGVLLILGVIFIVAGVARTPGVEIKGTKQKGVVSPAKK